MSSTSRLLVLPAVILAACGDDTSSSGAGGAGGGSQSGAVSLTVLSVERSTAPIDGSPPGDGDVFVIVDMTLRNEDQQSVPLAASAFAVRDATGVEYGGDPRTELLDGGCPADASVTPGGEATCKVLFEPPASSDLTFLAYSHPTGFTTVPLDLDGAGGGSPGDGCAQRAVGDHLLAVSVQLLPDKPLFFTATSIVAGDGLSLQLYPLRTPYRETEGGEVMTPIGTGIPLLVDVVAGDGSFTATTGEVTIPGDANPFSPRDLVASLTFTGTACPGEPDGAFCGTVEGEVTEPLDIALGAELNAFAFNPVGTAAPVYDCAGSVAASF